MKRWRCTHCDFLAWTDSAGKMENVVQTHLLTHYSSKLSKSDFRITWDCPYCATAKTDYDKTEAVSSFKSHLHGHVEDRIHDHKHIAERLGWDGTIQINTQVESPEADTLRRHFDSHADLVIHITANPERRIRLLHDELTDWPDRIVVVSTDGHPFDETTELDFAGVPMELVELDPRLGPKQVGETVSRILDIHHTDGMQVSVAVDILNEIVRSFDLRTSCDFVRMLASRLEEVDGVFQLYVNRDSHPNISTALNFLEEVFDLTISAEDQRFVKTK